MGEEKSQEETADRHLYVIPNLRRGSSLLEYQDYCTYQDSLTKPDQEKIKQTKPNTDLAGQDAADENNNKPFNWPADHDVMEGLRRFQNQRTEISEEMRSKLADIGILRDTDCQGEISAGKIENKATCSGTPSPPSPGPGSHRGSPRQT